MLKVADLSIEELKKIIHESVEESLEDYIEDIKASMSAEYIESIRLAREDFEKGRAKTFEEIFDV